MKKSGSSLAIYWIATILVCIDMTYVAVAYLTHDPKMAAAFASLGYPGYFPMILGTAKILGAIALLLPGLARLKEWAYAGFTFTFIGACWSHLAVGQEKALLMPLLALVVLAVSYFLRPDERRVVPEDEADVTRLNRPLPSH